MKKSFFYNNKRISYKLLGKGKSVMLVHGFGEDGNIWKNQFEDVALASRYQFIIPDLPGSGESEMIEDMTMEGIAEVLHAIIHEENIHSLPVLGHSMGGYITLALAEKYWNHISSIGLIHSTSFADSDEKKAIRQKGIEFIRQHGAFEFLKTTALNLFSSKTKEDEPDLVSDFIKTLDTFSADALIAYYEAMMKRPDRSYILSEADYPVLVIAGEHDNAVPFNDSLKQSHLANTTYFNVLHESGHMGMLEEPEELNKFLYLYLN